MGHLWSDESLDELYDFAVGKLKLKPEWNHYSRHFPHFDLTTKKKRDLAIKLGAVYIKRNRNMFKKVEEWAKKFYDESKHLEFWYKSKGLVDQDILRIDFKKLGIPKVKQQKLL